MRASGGVAVVVDAAAAAPGGPSSVPCCPVLGPGAAWDSPEGGAETGVAGAPPGTADSDPATRTVGPAVPADVAGCSSAPADGAPSAGGGTAPPSVPPSGGAAAPVPGNDQAVQAIRVPQEPGGCDDIARGHQLAYLGGGNDAAFIAQRRDDLNLVHQSVPNLGEASGIALATLSQSEVVANQQPLELKPLMQSCNEILRGGVRCGSVERVCDHRIHAQG